MNSSGKILTVFFVIIAVLLLSLTAASMFFFQKEIDKREVKEQLLAKAEVTIEKKKKEITSLKKETLILKSKNKELDDMVESLTSDLDLEKGLKEEIKGENLQIKEELKKVSSAKEKILSDLDTKESERKKIEKELQQIRKNLADIEETLVKEKDVSTKLSEENMTLKSEKEELQKVLEEMKSVQASSSTEGLVEIKTTPKEEALNLKQESQKKSKLAKGVELEPIVVTPESEVMPITTIPNEIPEGRILSVDEDTDFVIVNLGSKDGVKAGYVLSLYRGKTYLGDIKVTRVQPEMFAADIIPPLTSKMIRKNDQVIVKK